MGIASGSFPGEFEAHLTVQTTPHFTVEALRAWGEARGLKCVHIVLASGRTASQPMLTRRCRSSTLSAERQVAAELCDDLRSAGFAVIRAKIEAAPTNDGVPVDDVDAANEPADRHFEHHVKLVLEPDADLQALTAIARASDGHLSRNALRQRDDGKLERFVTQRCYGVGRNTARDRLDRLLSALAIGNYDVADVEQEYVVYDSNIDVDAGWLDVR